MLKLVQAEVAEMILRGQNPHVDAAKSYQLRPAVQVVPAPSIEPRKSSMQVHRGVLPDPTSDDRGGGSVPVRSYA
jgi:hypothetical protein